MGVQWKSLGTDELESRINDKRNMLIQIVLETGINSKDTLVCSQTLDELIALYQKREMNKMMCD